MHMYIYLYIYILLTRCALIYIMLHNRCPIPVSYLYLCLLSVPQDEDLIPPNILSYVKMYDVFVIYESNVHVEWLQSLTMYNSTCTCVCVCAKYTV